MVHWIFRQRSFLEDNGMKKKNKQAGKEYEHGNRPGQDMNRIPSHPKISFISSYTIHTLVLLIGLGILCLSNSPVVALENKTIQCGVILPLSGDLNLSGQYLLNGIELAVQEINEKEGSGNQIVIDVRDDQSNPDLALSLFKEMQSAQIPVVIGSYTTFLTQPMAVETKNNQGTILISPQANGDALYGISPAFFQMQAPVFYLGNFISEWLSFTAERVAIIYPDNEYGRSLMDEITSDLADGRTQITGSEPLTPDSNIEELIQRVLDGGPDTVVVEVYDARRGDIIKKLADAGYRGQVELTKVGIIQELGDEAAVSLQPFSLCIISTTSALVPGAHTDRFINAYKEKFGDDPTESIAGYGYDSMMILYDAILFGSEKGNISAASIQKGLNNIQYYGVTGPKVFDDKNAVNPAMDRWVYQNGSFELMTTSVM